MTTCPAPGCGKVIAESSTACLPHWKALPRGLRVKIGQQRGHAHNLAVQLAKAQRVWSGEPPPSRGRRHDPEWST